ncbi:MAG: hypothetical protein AAF700_14965 [Pseudomonadota bacterium]
MTQPPEWYGQALWRILALIAVFLSMAGVGAAQEHPQSARTGGDELHLQWLGDGTALLTYWNSDAMTSRNGDTYLTVEGLAVTANIQVTGGRETLRVSVPKGFVAVPNETHVADGQRGEVLIVPLEELQMF